MWRRIDVYAPAGRVEHGPQVGDDRALAVGAGDVDDRRQAALRMADRVEQPPDAAERQVDELRMQLRQPLEDDIGGTLVCHQIRPAQDQAVKITIPLPLWEGD